MKKRLLMILTLAFFLVGCGNTDKPDTEANKLQMGTESTTESEKSHEHAYTDSVTKEAICTEAGEKTFTCDCGDTYTEAIEATGHNYKDEINAPTCSEKGYTTHTCETCGSSYTDAEVSASGHSYGQYTYNNDATYEKDGTETATCSACGETDTRTKSGTKLVKEEPSPEPTPSNPSGYPAILNTEDGWYLREDGVYQCPASWEVSPTNIGSEWIGKTLAEYCAAQGTSGITFTDPWYRIQIMNVDRWGDYVIGSRKLTTVTYEGCTVDIKIPF